MDLPEYERLAASAPNRRALMAANLKAIEESEATGEVAALCAHFRAHALRTRLKWVARNGSVSSLECVERSGLPGRGPATVAGELIRSRWNRLPSAARVQVRRGC